MLEMNHDQYYMYFYVDFADYGYKYCMDNISHICLK